MCNNYPTIEEVSEICNTLNCEVYDSLPQVPDDDELFMFTQPFSLTSDGDSIAIKLFGVSVWNNVDDYRSHLEDEEGEYIYEDLSNYLKESCVTMMKVLMYFNGEKVEE